MTSKKDSAQIPETKPKFTGFHYICKDILSLTSSTFISFEIFYLMLNEELRKDPIVSNIRELGVFKNEADFKLVKSVDAYVKNSIDNNNAKAFLKKGDIGGKCSLSNKYQNFLVTLSDQVLDKEKQKSIDLEVIDDIRHNLYNILLQNVRFNSSSGTTKEDQLDNLLKNGVKNMIAGHALGKAASVEEALITLNMNDSLGAVTWLMIFSLYPDADEYYQLKGKLLKAFQNTYKQEIIYPETISPLSKSASFENQLKVMAAEEVCPEDKIRIRMLNYLDNPDNVFSDSQRTLYSYLSLLYSDKEFLAAKFDGNRLSLLLQHINKTLTLIGYGGDYIDDPKRFEEVHIISLQLLLKKADIYWRLLKLDQMYETLFEIENFLYYNEGFNSKYPYFYAKTNQKLGIYYNRIMHFENAIQVYCSAYNTFDKSMNYYKSMIKNNEAIVYKKWRRFDKAIQAYDVAFVLRHYRSLNDEKAKCVLYSNMAIPYGIVHEFYKATTMISEAYEIRKRLYAQHNMPIWSFINTTIFYAFIIMLRLVYDNPDAKSAEAYRNKATELFDEADRLITEKGSTIAAQGMVIDYYLTRGTFSYYSKDYETSEYLLQTAINLYSDEYPECSNRIRSTAYIYKAKNYYFQNHNITRCLKDLVTAFKDIKKLYDESTNKTYFQYFYMGICFHLGALIYLEDIDSDTLREHSIDVTKEELIETADLIMQDMIKPSKYLFEQNPEKKSRYMTYNQKAFDREASYINTLKSAISKGSYQSLISLDKDEVLEAFRQFYIITDNDW